MSTNNDVESKYLTIKTNTIIQKLKSKYVDIVAMDVQNDPGNLRIGFQSWGPAHKIVLVLGGKNEQSFWINNVGFKTNVVNNGSIEPNTLNKEFEDLCVVIDNLLADYNRKVL